CTRRARRSASSPASATCRRSCTSQDRPRLRTSPRRFLLSFCQWSLLLIRACCSLRPCCPMRRHPPHRSLSCTSVRGNPCPRHVPRLPNPSGWAGSDGPPCIGLGLPGHGMRLHIHHEVGSGDGLCGSHNRSKETITVTPAEIIYQRRIAV